MSFNDFEWTEFDIDLDVDTETVGADRGGVAAGGDISDTAVNTGALYGIQNADGDVDAADAVIGNGNITFSGGDLGAVALGGSATNVEAGGSANLGSGTLNEISGGNVNMGSGQLINVDSNGGQTVVGSGNELTGDVDVEMDDVDGNANLAIGDGNEQVAVQEDSFSLDTSHTDNSVDTYFTDNSINDSGNLLVDDSFNTDVEASADIEDNDVYEDNDTTTNTSSWRGSFSETEIDTDLDWVEGTDVDIDG